MNVTLINDKRQKQNNACPWWRVKCANSICMSYWRHYDRKTNRIGRDKIPGPVSLREILYCGTPFQPAMALEEKKTFQVHMAPREGLDRVRYVNLFLQNEELLLCRGF